MPIPLKSSHILFLDQGEFLGGAERFLIDFFKALTVSEFAEIRPILVGGQHIDYRKSLPDVIFEDFEFPSVRGNVFLKFFAIFKLLISAYKLKKLGQQKQAICFFSNTPRTHFVMFLTKKIFRVNVRWIAMFHDFTVPTFLLRRITGTADVLIANAVTTRNFLRKNSSSKNFEKIRIVENGINFDLLPQSVPAKQIKNILILGRIDPRKGQLFALQAAQILQDSHSEIMFNFVGSSVKTDKRTLDYEKKCLNFVKKKNLKNVQFFPETQRPFEQIAKTDLVLFLPTEPETFGRIVIEALALEKLVLSFNETGPREILQLFERKLKEQNIDVSSVLVEQKNAKILAEKIIFFIKNPKKIKLFTMHSKEFVLKNFALKETKKRLIAILNNY